MDLCLTKLSQNDKTLILIVDDQKDTRLAVKLALKKENYVFEEAVNGQEAIDKCRELKPDVILMDAVMPLLDGFEATKAIRALKGFEHVSILMITALTQKSDKIKALESGVNDFISKPFDKQELIARCKSYAKISLDIARRKVAEEALQEQHTYLQNIVDGIDDPIMVINQDYTVSLMNNVVKSTLHSKNIADKNNPKCYEISHDRSTPCDGLEHPCPLKEVLETKSHVNVIHDHSDTHKKYVELSASPLLDKNGECVGIIESGRDITAHLDIQEELNRQKEKLQFQAHHDPLTGLANRILFQDRLDQAIIRSQRNKTKVALFFIDLDKFKPINDTYGHKAGDIVLKVLSKRIQDIIRKEDTLARIGGDEFVVIVEHILNTKDVVALSKKIIDVVSKPIDFEALSLSISASIGISICPDDASQTDKLLKYADIAMYNAKKDVKNDSIFYSIIKEN